MAKDFHVDFTTKDGKQHYMVPDAKKLPESLMELATSFEKQGKMFFFVKPTLPQPATDVVLVSSKKEGVEFTLQVEDAVPATGKPGPRTRTTGYVIGTAKKKKD